MFPWIGPSSRGRGADIQRMQSVKQQSPEEMIVKDRAETASTIRMAVAAGITIVFFILIWWLVVH